MGSIVSGKATGWLVKARRFLARVARTLTRTNEGRGPLSVRSPWRRRTCNNVGHSRADSLSHCTIYIRDGRTSVCLFPLLPDRRRDPPRCKFFQFSSVFLVIFILRRSQTVIRDDRAWRRSDLDRTKRSPARYRPPLYFRFSISWSRSSSIIAIDRNQRAAVPRSRVIGGFYSAAILLAFVSTWWWHVACTCVVCVRACVRVREVTHCDEWKRELNF